MLLLCRMKFFSEFLQFNIQVNSQPRLYTVFRKKVVYFVFEHNFTTTGSIFLQFSMTITK